jgi:hypothetical protein
MDKEMNKLPIPILTKNEKNKKNEKNEKNKKYLDDNISEEFLNKYLNKIR